MPHTTCGRMVSGSLHFPSRVLCSFHSRYYCAIGLKTCLGFEVGAPDLHARFPTHATQKTRHHPPACPYRTITLSGAPFQETSGSLGWVDTGSQLHISTCFRVRIRIALCRFRSPLLTASLLISFPLPTKMLQSGRLPYPKGMHRRPVQDVQFGHPRIIDSMRLPGAYRSLARPSSALEPSHPPCGVTAI